MGILWESEKLGKSHFWDYGDCWQQNGHFSGPPKKRPNFRTTKIDPIFRTTKIDLFSGPKKRPEKPDF